MNGSLNDILPEPISSENQQIILNLLKRRMMSCLALSVDVLHAMEKHFGPEARDVIREMASQHEFDVREDVGVPEADLQELCGIFEQMSVGSQHWRRVTDTPTKIGYNFTHCMYAEILRELGEPELGLIMCTADEPYVKSYNPKLGFQRTKTLMEGDEICDHIFLVEQ